MKKGLELKPATLDIDFIDKWSVENPYQYYNLYLDGKKLRDALYRSPEYNSNITIGVYTLLKKYVPGVYELNDGSEIKKVPQLLGQFCIINQLGDEARSFDPSYYVSVDGFIYTSMDGHFNIETNEFHGKGPSLVTEKYLFIDNGKEGVKKINFSDGTFEIFN